MKPPRHTIFALLIAAACCSAGRLAVASDTAVSAVRPALIVRAANSPANVQLAARELRRYLYLRTGALGSIVDRTGPSDSSHPVAPIRLVVDPALAPQAFRIEANTIAGGSDIGVLYGAYRFIEHLGVRFQLDGDVIPDERLAAVPVVNDAGNPLFEMRGIQPFHDFPEGPDWWTQDHWLSVMDQVVKMRMNFIGLHCYPFRNGDLGPEPLVWVGLPEDVNPDGTVKRADYASWYTTAKFMPYGCYRPMKTGDYGFGGSQVFATDDYGPEVNTPDDFPMPKTPEARVAMFNKVGTMMNTVFTEARRRGIKIAVGTESPLSIPDVVQAQLKEHGMDPQDPATIRKLYEGMFTRIARVYPIDTYWIWGHEGDIKQQEFIDDFQAAYAARAKTGVSFDLGICGWGWVTGHFPALDKVLPKDVTFSAINMSLGRTPVSQNFQGLAGRPKWAIAWVEDDSHLASIQPRAGRIRRDSEDALRYGCDGLMGIFWRTRILAPALASLAEAGWQHGTSVHDLYQAWAIAQFGPGVGPEAGLIFHRLDGNFPAPSSWIRGPGAIVVGREPWAKASARYAFVDQFAALRPRVAGAGSLERFDWWLGMFRVSREMGRFGALRGELDSALAEIDKRPVDERAQRAQERALPIRLEMTRAAGAMSEALLAGLHNSTELGTLCNIEQQSMNRLKLLTGQDDRLVKFLGEPLPPEAQPWRDYRGAARLVAMTARGKASPGESLRIPIVALSGKPVEAVTVYVRPLGQGAWKAVPARHVARAVHEATLPPASGDFEYYITAGDLVWPATAPQLNQTVIVVP